MVVDWDEVFEEFEEAVGFGVFLAILWHISKDWLSMFAEYGKLEKQCGIEHHIGILLIWEYPTLFTTTH